MHTHSLSLCLLAWLLSLMMHVCMHGSSTHSQVGGEKEAVEFVKPLFSIMGKNIMHMGPAGAGQNTKMAS